MKSNLGVSGIPVIAERKYLLLGKFNKLYVHGNHEHMIGFGGSGSGKTQSLVFPLLQSIVDADENAVIHDCKLELFEHFGKKFKDKGYNVIVLNYSNPKYSHRYNPFTYPIQKWKEALKKNNLSPCEFRKCKSDLSEAIENIKDIATILCYEEDNDKNSYFWKGAGNMMAGAALLLAEEGRFDCINGKGLRMLYKMDKTGGHDHKLLTNFLDTCRELDDDSRIQMSVYLNADGITRGNISSTFEQKIEILGLTPDIQYLTSDSEFDMRDIFNKKTVVFILTQDEKDIYYPLVTVFLKQLYEVGVRLTREGDSKEWKYKMNWILEEMGILPEIKNFKNIYNAARSRGLTIYGFMQSMADMIDKYEEEGTRTILENCRVQVYIHGETEETNNYFKERCGKESFYNSKTKKWEERYILTKERMNKLEKGRILVTIAGQDPYIAKLPPYKDYVFYQKPDLKFLQSDSMFGEKGRLYKYEDIDKWFRYMEKAMEQFEFTNQANQNKEEGAVESNKDYIYQW